MTLNTLPAAAGKHRRTLGTLARLALLVAMLWGMSLPLLAQTAPLDVTQWIVYGTTSDYLPDAKVYGGSAVKVLPLKTPVEEWTSGAVLPIPKALKAGEQISAVFWARAAEPVAVNVTIQGGAPSYPVVAQTTAALTPQWQRISISGVAASDLAAASQSLVLHLGKTPTAVSLGPVLFHNGTLDEVDIAVAFVSFRATRLEDIRIASAPGVTLEGTLQSPRGKGPFPLVVCFSGSGPSKRGIFKLLAERLHAEGIATFEYDKRGVGKSTGVFDDTFAVIQADATAVVRGLRRRPDIDPARIGVCGLSQGGVVGPLLAAEDPQIAAVVMFAGPVGAQGDLFLGGLRRKLQQSGTRSPAAIERIVETVRVWMDARAAKMPEAQLAVLQTAAQAAFATEGTTPEQAEAMIAVLNHPVLQSMYEVGPDNTLARVKVPVLALYGEKDTVLVNAECIPAAKAALKNNPDATVVVIPGATHVFRTEGSTELYPVSIPEMLDLVTTWLVVRLHPQKLAP